MTHLYAYLEDNTLISSKQFGFENRHSTVEQLLLSYDDMTKMVDSGNTVDLIFFFNIQSILILSAMLYCWKSFNVSVLLDT